jgi:DNA polymerase sigma
MFQMLQSQNYDLQHLTTHEGSMCTQNHERREWITHSQTPLYIELPNPKVATIFKPQP